MSKCKRCHGEGVIDKNYTAPCGDCCDMEVAGQVECDECGGTGKAGLGVHIRWMIRRDMKVVLEIENDVSRYPWVEDDFIRCLRQRNCIGMVAESDEQVVGYMIYELHKDRLHVLAFAVRRDCQRQGVGRSMVAKLVTKLSDQRRKRIEIEVRESNLDAQLFFRSCGFSAVDVLRDYYEEQNEDAYEMWYRVETRTLKGVK